MKAGKLPLILEALFAGFYLSLTRGLFIIYLVAVGLDVSGISYVVLVSTAVAAVCLALLYKFPEFMVRRVKLKLLTAHIAERLSWLIMAFLPTPLFITLSYLGVSVAAALTGGFMNFVIYALYNEEEVKDLTAKRNMMFNITSVLGLIVAMLTTALLEGPQKYLLLIATGVSVGILSSLSMSILPLSQLEGQEIPKGVENPEKVMSTSLFLLSLLVYGNLMGIIWIPYLTKVLGAPDFMAVAMTLATTLASIAGSVIWSSRSYKDFRAALAATSAVPASALLVPLPLLHMAIASVNGIAYTGANFLGNFLLARYSSWFGAVRSGIILTLIVNASQFLAAPLGIIFSGNFTALFITAASVVILSTTLAFTTIPEVAIVPEHTARTYSQTIYYNSLMGYVVAVETVKDTLLLTLKLVGLSVALLLMYVAYRFLIFLINIIA